MIVGFTIQNGVGHHHSFDDNNPLYLTKGGGKKIGNYEVQSEIILVSNSIIRNNLGSYGSGISISCSMVYLKGKEIYRNSALVDDGGICYILYTWDGADITMIYFDANEKILFTIMFLQAFW